VQAGDLFWPLEADTQKRLIANLAGGLPKVKIPGVVDRPVSYFERVDADPGRRPRLATERLRGSRIWQR